MNKQFKEAVADSIFRCTQTMLADIFNIFANHPDNLEFYLQKEEVYVFNILNNKQAARAVSKFGFETIATYAKEDWIIYAELNDLGKWIFSTKSPTQAVREFLEPIIHDMIARPKEYPAWAWDHISLPLTNLIEQHYD